MRGVNTFKIVNISNKAVPDAKIRIPKHLLERSKGENLSKREFLTGRSSPFPVAFLLIDREFLLPSVSCLTKTPI